MATQASIKLNAITRLGSDSGQSIATDSDEQAACDRIYEGIVAEFLCKHAWTFSTRDTVVEVTATVPEYPWLYQFDVPVESINIREITRGGKPALYELREGKILAMGADDLNVIHNWRSSEERWPGDFAAAVTEELLGQLFEAFEEPTRGKETRASARMMLRGANRRDRGQRKNSKRFENPHMLKVWANRNSGRV